MEDLDTLQMELETLLNTVVIRSQSLQKEIAGMTEKVYITCSSILPLLYDGNHLICVSLPPQVSVPSKRSVPPKNSEINMAVQGMPILLHC